MDTKPTNPKDRAATARIDLGLFPDTAVVYGALAMTEGDLKYGAYNYRDAGVAASIYRASVARHFAEWWNGEDLDPRTGVPHLASALAGIAVLIDATVLNKLNDDRPPKSPVGDLIRDLEAKVKHLQGLFPNPPGRYTEIGCQERSSNAGSSETPSVDSRADVPHGEFIKTGTASP